MRFYLVCPVYSLDSSLNAISHEEGVFNWSKFTWYLESCTKYVFDAWRISSKFSWYLSSAVCQLHWQQLLPNHGNDLWASNVAGALPRSYDLNPPEVCSFRSHLQDVRTMVRKWHNGLRSGKWWNWHDTICLMSKEQMDSISFLSAMQRPFLDTNVTVHYEGRGSFSEYQAIASKRYLDCWCVWEA